MLAKTLQVLEQLYFVGKRERQLTMYSPMYLLDILCELLYMSNDFHSP